MHKGDLEPLDRLLSLPFNGLTAGGPAWSQIWLQMSSPSIQWKHLLEEEGNEERREKFFASAEESRLFAFSRELIDRTENGGQLGESDLVETLAVVDAFWSLYLGDQLITESTATFEMEVDVEDPGSLERLITMLGDGAGDSWENIYQWRRVECLIRISNLASLGAWVLDIYARLGPLEYLERFHKLLRGPEMSELIRFPAVYLGPGSQLTQDKFVRVFIRTQRLIGRIIEIDSEMKPKPFPSPSRGNDLPVNRPPQS